MKTFAATTAAAAENNRPNHEISPLASGTSRKTASNSLAAATWTSSTAAGSR